MKRALTLTAVALALALAGCAAPATATGPAAAPPGISARGVGTVSGTPDTVTVVLGVATNGPAAAAALKDNTARATALIEVLRGSGVAPEDLRTSGLSIYPTYADGGTISGYEVSNQVTAVLRDLAGAGALIDAAAQAAGDAVRVQQITFSLDDDAEQRAAARADAVRRAEAQIAEMAQAAGASPGGLLSITEIPVEAGPQPFAAADGAAAEQASAVPLLPGTQDVTVVVEVVRAIG
ncbi:SIMPL domain-containing protein [Pseudonocardia sp. KRD-184]|uniref:SIMPL domain-containing protein n=1 Tax=Pseudonocardia oceani TaxID=2792013 RepID=A0ABS6UD16_9PSEU|nr:SIMPL domain-containing protein [Pseudonocardia oceani]MBW0090995.1 SIMPL domain-containing protein [Pseudonocardia oceani]MBW0095739.1 SIMPL domain-containing protein [Pseudonocardia oceani]MBW0108298.1 SIMPL domain-containing protein [Pseudonocardia oceani]MBW0121385.1 SIMPL domain-containing protein [Pseudonocardia oceani]MBW0130097.1 SIMPL domain-containing protein [Pseudonocardia oceani]